MIPSRATFIPVGIVLACAFAFVRAHGAEAGVKIASISEAIRSAQKATVEVLVDGQLKGGGAFVSEDGLVITAAHLFAQPDVRFTVITASDERLRAELVAIDKGHDLALLKISDPKKETRAVLEVAKGMPPVGTRVFNLGVALRNRGVVMEGTVAQGETAFNEFAESNGYVETYFVSAMTPSLTSGGVWINAGGKIVGVQSARLNDGILTSGIAMVAPPRAIAKLIRTRKDASTPDFGAWVWEVWTADQEFLASIPPDTEGLVITWLREGGPMESTGLKRLDTILKCNGKPVRRRVEFLRMIRAVKPGATVALTILGQNQAETKEIEVTLESQEALWQRLAREREKGSGLE